MILTSSWPLARVGVGQNQLLKAPDPLVMFVMMVVVMRILVLMVMGDKVPLFYIYKLPINRSMAAASIVTRSDDYREVATCRIEASAYRSPPPTQHCTGPNAGLAGSKEST